MMLGLLLLPQPFIQGHHWSRFSQPVTFTQFYLENVTWADAELYHLRPVVAAQQVHQPLNCDVHEMSSLRPLIKLLQSAASTVTRGMSWLNWNSTLQAKQYCVYVFVQYTHTDGQLWTVWFIYCTQIYISPLPLPSQPLSKSLVKRHSLKHHIILYSLLP